MCFEGLKQNAFTLKNLGLNIYINLLIEQLCTQVRNINYNYLIYIIKTEIYYKN